MMQKQSDRFDILKTVLMCIFVVLVIRLSFMTIVKGDDYFKQAQDKVFRKITVQAPRGEIKDRYGRLIAGNRPSFTVQISKNEVAKDNMNSIALGIIDILEKNGDKYADEFPIELLNGKFSFTFDRKIREWKAENAIPKSYTAKESFYYIVDSLIASGAISPESRNIDKFELQKLLNENGYYPPIYVSQWLFAEQVRKKEWLYGYDIDIEKEKGIDAKEAFERIKKYYELPSDYNDADARKVMIIRDLVKSKGYLQYQPVEVAYDVSQKTVAEIEEKSMELTGVSVEVKPVRYYPNGDVASHILGYMGKISLPYEIEKYVDEKGYSKSDTIGKSGIEKQYEESLKGENGYKRVQVDAAGRLVKRLEMKDPVPGDSVYLTIDLELQKKAEESLKTVLSTIRQGGVYTSKWGSSRLRDSKRVYSKATSGAVVALDVKTGDVLALASYPGFDPNLFATGISSEDMAKLLPENKNDPLAPRPLYNVATMTTVQPGSVFKMVTGLAGLEKGLSPKYKITDRGRIMLGNKSFGCWLWNERKGTHGPTDLYKALEVSCNYYFYCLSVGFDYGANKPLPVQMGIEDILYYARLLGLDEKTGIQIEEFSGKVPNPSDKLKTTKLMLESTLEIKLENAFTDITSESDPAEYKKRIDKMVSWTEENPGRGEIIKRLGGLKVKEDSVNEITDIMKYNYFSQAQWSTGDSFNIGIGQGENSYSPIQMANYISALTNGGYKNKVTVVDKIESYDKLNIEKIKRESVKIPLNDVENLEHIKKGMKKVTEEGTASSTFGNFPVEVGGKTGTAQKSGRVPAADEAQYLLSHLSSFGVGKDEVMKLADSMEKNSDEKLDRDYYLRAAIQKLNPKIKTSDINRFKDTYDNFAWFVSFAPYDKPEIAVVVLIFQGGHGGYGGPIARDVIGQYMGLETDYSQEKIDYSGGLTQ